MPRLTGQDREFSVRAMSRIVRGVLFAGLAVLGLGLGGCPPSYPKCESDKNCRANEYCVNGQCQQCRSDGDCEPGQACRAGRCEAAAKKCADDTECPAGQSCLKGVCKACVSDGQCGDGGKCNAGRCARASSDGSDGSDGSDANAGPCKLEPIYFDFNEAQLSQEANQAIERNVECLKKAGQKPVNLVGHTDSRGTEEYNLALSDQRAQSVKIHLTRLGIDPVRLRPVPKGEMDATGTDDSGYVKDRRVDMQW